MLFLTLPWRMLQNMLVCIAAHVMPPGNAELVSADPRHEYQTVSQGTLQCPKSADWKEYLLYPCTHYATFQTSRVCRFGTDLPGIRGQVHSRHPAGNTCELGVNLYIGALT